MKKTIKVTAPASVSNVGPGFDIMGFAIDQPSDEIILKNSSSKGITIKKISGDNGQIPLEAKNNTAGYAIQKLMEKTGDDNGYEIEIKKITGLGGGLGSSAASAVAAVFAYNEFIGKPFSKDELLEYALLGESIASGAIHADNVAPSLYGGFILIRSYDPIDIIHLSAPKNLFCTVVYPQIVIKTSEARKILKKTISLKDGIAQCGNVAGLIAGLFKKDYQLLGRSLQDRFAEPYRAKLIPGYAEIKQSAVDAGAIGCSISGSGPSIFALSDNLDDAKRIGNALKKTVSKNGMKSKLYISGINHHGPEVIG